MGRVCCCGVPRCRPGSCEGWARPVGTPSPGPRSQLGPPRPSGRYWMGNGSICKESGAPGQAGPGSGSVGPGWTRAEPGPRALPGPACPSRARPARFAGPGLPLPGRSAQISRSRSVAGPARRKPAWQTVLPGPVCGTSAGPLTHSRARAGGFAGPVLREAGRRGENRPGKSTLGGPGAATFDPAGARRCPCRARNRPRPGPPHLRPGPQLYPAAS